MIATRFKRHSISLDEVSLDRCKSLAEAMSTSVSGLLRLLVRNAYENQEHISEKQEGNRSCL
jgi:hypothetical protein